MLELCRLVKHKINDLIWTLLSTGIILLLLGVLIVWTDFLLRLTIGLFVLVVGYTFLYFAYKLYAVKRDIERRLKLK